LYILERWCRPKDSGLLKPWGEFVHLSETDVRNKGLDIILADLATFRTRDCSAGSEFTISPQRKKKAWKLLGECDEVAISLHLGSELWIDPMIVTGRRKARGEQKDRLFLSLPSTNEKFFSILEEAYEKCCTVYQ
jgi:hypothetical protein